MSDEQTVELLPCPFCGGTDFYARGIDGMPYCGNCGAQSGRLDWNTRTDTIPALLAAEREKALRDQWQPIETAPKDGTNILVYYSHDADPFLESETRLTPYAAWTESGDFMDGNGICIAAWHPAHWESTDEYGDGYYLPAYWFAYQMGDYEYVVNPTHWMPLPPAPEDSP